VTRVRTSWPQPQRRRIHLWKAKEPSSMANCSVCVHRDGLPPEDKPYRERRNIGIPWTPESDALPRFLHALQVGLW